MNEYTLRNKATTPIMTLTPAMLALMLKARPESIKLVLAKTIKDYKEVTGKSLSLDYDQNLKLLEHAGADAWGAWTSRYANLPYPFSHVKPTFADGFMLSSRSGSMVENLELAEAFHSLLDMQLEAAASKSNNTSA